MNNLRKVETSYRIMKVLKLLHEKPRSLNELCFELDTSGIGVERETITKYFQTLRSCGCTIEKRGGKFYLLNMPFFIDLNIEELKTLAHIQKLSQKFHSNVFDQKIQSIYSKILKLTDLTTHTNYHAILNKTKLENVFVNEEIDKNIIFIISNFLEYETKIKIQYKNKYYTITPKSFIFIQNKLYLNAFIDKTNKFDNFKLSDITEVINLGQSGGLINFASTTVFKLKGRLANGYYPYKEETVEVLDNGDKIITNKTQDKSSLMKRLLKYGNLCEIILPKDERENFKDTIQKMISNFEIPN